MTNEATFDNLEEAQGEARSYLEQQRRVGASLSVIIEEKAPDGTVVKHVVALSNPVTRPLGFGHLAPGSWPDEQWRAAPRRHRTGRQEQAECGFLRILAAERPRSQFPIYSWVSILVRHALFRCPLGEVRQVFPPSFVIPRGARPEGLILPQPHNGRARAARNAVPILPASAGASAMGTIYQLQRTNFQRHIQFVDMSVNFAGIELLP